MNLQNNPYDPLVMSEEYNCIQWGIKKKGIQTCYDNMRNDAKTTLFIRSFKNMDAIHKLVARMPAYQAIGEWELHTLEDMRLNDNQQRLINYWS